MKVQTMQATARRQDKRRAMERTEAERFQLLGVAQGMEMAAGVKDERKGA